MKTLSQEELKTKAADVFKHYRKAQKVAVTSDGMVFITDNSENAVVNHSKRNRYGRELKIVHFTRDDIEGSGAPEKTAKELIAEIETATDRLVVVEIYEAEKNGKARKSVLEAAEKRFKELKADKQ